MILNDKEIKEKVLNHSMIEPFFDHQVKETNKGIKVISYGLSSFGYDIRLDNKVKVFRSSYMTEIDPKDFESFKKCTDTIELKDNDYVVIPPNSFILANSKEKFNIPKNVFGIVLGKSTLARCGINTLCTPLEPGWSGYLTLEFANTTSVPVRMYISEGCAQIVFFKGNTPLSDYSGGKYQDQERTPVFSKM